MIGRACDQYAQGIGQGGGRRTWKRPPWRWPFHSAGSASKLLLVARRARVSRVRHLGLTPCLLGGLGRGGIDSAVRRVAARLDVSRAVLTNEGIYDAGVTG